MTLLSSATLLQAEQGMHLFFTGSIENKPVQMNMFIDRDVVSGTFRFCLEDNPIQLTGIAVNKTDSNLSENIIKISMKTGSLTYKHFSGILSSQNYKGILLSEKKRIPFELKRTAAFQKIEISAGENLATSLTIPLLSENKKNSSINRFLNELKIKQQNFIIENEDISILSDSGCTHSVEVSIICWSDKWITLKLDDYSYITGAAHGYYYSEYFCWRQTGTGTGSEIIPINVLELPNFITHFEKIKKTLIEELAMMNASAVKNGEESLFTIENMKPGGLLSVSIGITDSGVHFAFPPYSLDSYAKGDFQIFIPINLTN